MPGPPPATAAVRLAVRRHLLELPSEARVLVACSGGADSLALAAAVAHEAPRAGLPAGAVTVDHGLQAGSGERAATVADALHGLALAPVEVLAVEVGPGGGPEAASRAARYAALADAAARLGASAVLLGHTRDDQAETVLLGLARGSGARSLSGMRPVSGLLRRPLLGLSRTTVRSACEEAGLVAWEDPHNADPAYARTRVRHAALPALEAALGPGVAAALARTADLLRADADALDAWALDARRTTERVDGSLDVDGLLALPAAVRGRVLRAWAVAGGAPATDLTAAHVRAVDALLTDWHGQAGIDLPGGRRAVRAGGVLRLRGAFLHTDS